MINFRPDAMHFRHFTENDLERIAFIESRSIKQPWSLQALRDFSKQPTSRILVAAHGSKMPVGYITYSVVLDEVQIANIAVDEDFRRHGIAKNLLKTLYASAKTDNMSVITLEVRASNAPAIALYEKCRYVMVGRRKNYYSDPKEDAILMNLNL